MEKVTKIRKRDGRIVDFDHEKITEAIWKSVQAVGGKNRSRAVQLSSEVIKIVEKRFEGQIPSVEDIQDIVEKVLIENGHAQTAKAYILYRQKHKELRNVKELFSAFDVIEDYLDQSDWRVRENSNMTYSLQGLNNHIATRIVSNYWLVKIYPPEVSAAHKSGDFHIHDLGIFGAYCVGWDLLDLIVSGFRGVSGKVETKPSKHFRVVLGQIVNFFYTLQGEAAGAQAFSNFDTLIAPFIRADDLSYDQIRQAMQEFLFNINVPTRVGFQCISEDTEILTPQGWKKYDEVKKGDIIKTFNMEKGIIENKKVQSVFKRKYTGVMYSLKNRIQDQLISPRHRVVRKKFQTSKYALEPIEDIIRLKSPFITPIAAENMQKEAPISDEKIKLMAWITGEGCIERPGRNYRSCYRISIYQSALKNKKNYEEIRKLLSHFKLKYSEYTQKGLGEPVQRIRLDAASSKKIHEWFGSRESVGFIPEILLNMSQRQSELFLKTYIKAEGFENCKIATSDIEILDGLQAIASNAGYGSTVLSRKPTIGSKIIYVLRLIKHKDTYINTVKKVNYSGIIWCPNTENETVIARRNNKVFITGNTPFTNITLDLTVSETFKDKPVVIGGKILDTVYGDYQEEMNMVNKAFAEVMMAGDAKGRVFTFPIPTYNLTKNFDWDNKKYVPIWEMTAKYGIPYFSNFINSDMKPEDARSMCCRLRLDNRGLKTRGGGLFGANPLTGSIGVVTINMPRLGHLSENEYEFFHRLNKLMDLAMLSLETKRKIIENFTEKGLYPYSKFYLRSIQELTGKYWQNHFSTIGLIGMNEALENFMGVNIADPEGQKFAIKVLEFMRKKLQDYQEETGNMYNLEATPGEGTSFRLARIDVKKFPRIVVAGASRAPYYTNSTHLPVNFTDDIFEALELQDPLQRMYTGGTVLHGFVGERLPSAEATKNLVKKIATQFRLPYFTITPTFSICPIHGYLPGEHEYCPKCEEE